MSFASRGLQYDRYGLLWLGEIEVLRTTTAEPSASGIHWSVEKDLTLYQSYLRSFASLPVSLAIPNNVDSKYTGVIVVNATLSFYGPMTTSAPTPLIVPLTNAPASGLWSPLSLDSNNSQIYFFRLPEACRGRRLRRLSLRTLASSHGCEEFYYTNPPNANATALDACNGGSYREIQVLVNGSLAAVVVPTIIVYSGGVNPLLWRPLAGPQSFDILPHEFELSPFLGQFAESSAANTSVQITLLVLVDGNLKVNSWMLDSHILIYFTDETMDDSSVILTGSVGHFTENITKSAEVLPRDGGLTFFVTSIHSHSFNSTLLLANNETIRYYSSFYLETESSNSYSDSGWEVCAIRHRSVIDLVITAGNGSILEETHLSSWFNLFLADWSAVDGSTFFLKSLVMMDTAVSSSTHGATNGVVESSWKCGIDSWAIYNKSLEGITIFQRDGRSNAYYIEEAPRKCRRKVDAFNGTITLDESFGTCGGPIGVHMPNPVSSSPQSQLILLVHRRPEKMV